MGTKKILVIAGGGAFGAIPARFLSEVEDLLSIREIDYFAGTSIGGIESLYLATGKTPSSLYEDFCGAVEDIFKPRLVKKVFPLWRGPTYDARNIEKFLKDVLPGTMGELKSKVVVPSVNFKLEVPRVFHNLKGSVDLKYDCWKVARATSAAPTYFAPYGQDIMIDGGLIENVPLMTAVTTLKSRENIRLDEMDVFIIGTGMTDVDMTKTNKQVTDYWPWEWATKMLLPFATKANEIASEHWGKDLGFHYFKYFNPVIINDKMDNAKLVTSGFLSECCDSHLGEFRKNFKEFLDA